MTIKLCAMCLQNIVRRNQTFCKACYKEHKDLIDEAIHSTQKPDWLRYMEVNCVQEARALEQERSMYETRSE